MSHPILLTGGTGTLGRLVAPRLTAAGHTVRVLSRDNHEPDRGVEFVGGDLETGDGIDAAVAGVDIVVHCAGSPKDDALKAQTLVAAAQRTGMTPHIVYISVVGAERIPVETGLDRRMFGYFEAKYAAERAIEESGLPWTTLRATQFHDLVLTAARAMAKLPVIPLPTRMRAQPVDAGEVADRLVELALGAPAGLVPDMAGPKVYGAGDLVRGYLRAAGRRRPIMPIGLPGKAAKAMLAGANLPLGGTVGTHTWEKFLAEHVHQDR